MTTLEAIWLGIGLGFLLLLAIAWLKGALGLARATAREFARDSGAPWTLSVAVEPYVAVVVVFFVAALGVAHPESRWARWFYGNRRMARARKTYGDHPSVDHGSMGPGPHRSTDLER